jgi:hypothetical protein
LLKVTDEIREAARRLLTKHNAAETERVEERYQEGLTRAEGLAQRVSGTANKERVRADAARERPADKEQRKRLEAIVDGTRKLIDPFWWRETHGDVDRAKLDKLERMADPARNANEHERAVAAAKLAAAKTRQPPGMRPRPAPLPQTSSEWLKARKTKTRSPPPSPQPSRLPSMADSVAPASVSDSVAAPPMSDSVARLNSLNERRAALRAAKRASLKCKSCGKPLAARRATARYCNATCRSHAWRA